MANDREPFSEKLRVPESLTFDDVLLRPKESRVEPDAADTGTQEDVVERQRLGYP